MIKNKLAFFLSLILICSCSSSSTDEFSESKEQDIPIRQSNLQRLDSGWSVPYRKTGGKFTKVTESFGLAKIQEGVFSAQSKTIPWSGPCYPPSHQSCDHSPLRKYDRYNYKEKGSLTTAAQFHVETLQLNSASSAEMFCRAWAFASILEPEPLNRRSVLLGEDFFTPGDLKELLIRSYEILDQVTQVGHEYQDEGSVRRADIYPDQFHRIIQKELFENQKSFVISKEPGGRVLYTPIYKAVIKVKLDSHLSYLYHVETTLTGIEPFSRIANPNISGKRETLLFYTYDLYGTPDEDGQIQVSYGEWTEKSIESHPDYAWIVPNEKRRRSENPEINAALVDEILAKAREIDRQIESQLHHLQ